MTTTTRPAYARAKATARVFAAADHTTVSNFRAHVAASAVMTADQERAAFRTLAKQHAAAWDAVLLGGTITDARADDPDWLALLAAQAEALQQAAAAINARGAALAETRCLGREWYRAVVRTRAALAATEAFIVEANVKLAVNIAVHAFHRSKVPVADREQAANIGVVKAIRRFNVERGLKFSTYATWWIRNAIQRNEMNTGDTIRTPVHMHDTSRLVRGVIARALVNGAVMPTMAQICAATNREPNAVRQALAIPTVVSADAPISTAGDKAATSTRLDFIANPAAIDPCEAIAARQTEDLVSEAVYGLPPKTRTVVVRFYGLAGHAPTSFADIAEHLGCSRQYVQILEKQGRAALRGVLPAMLGERLAC